MTRQSALGLLLLLPLLTNAFVVVPSALSPSTTMTSSLSPQGLAAMRPHQRKQIFSRFMTTADNEKSVDTEETAENEEEDGPVLITSEEEEEESEPAEDPELVALKEEIASLEGLLKEQRRQLMLTKDRAEDYSKAGYARKVAEMENMRRARSMLNSSSRSSAMAGTLSQFVPILDKLTELKSNYGDDEFGQQYNALPGALKTALTGLGVTEVTIKVGDPIDLQSMTVESSEHVDDDTQFPANTVLRVIRSGLELTGNVIQPAVCVASLGVEAPAAKEEEAAAAVEEEAPAEE